MKNTERCSSEHGIFQEWFGPVGPINGVYFRCQQRKRHPGPHTCDGTSFVTERPWRVIWPQHRGSRYDRLPIIEVQP